MSHDLTRLLDAWRYEDPDRLLVRWITAADGSDRIQIRIELGLLELRPTGRPDGLRPAGHESLLDLHLELVLAAAGADAEDSYRINREGCAELRREALQYYHRRIAYLQLGSYPAAAADADHNLGILDLLHDHAWHDLEWRRSEQFRAYILCQRATALALEARRLGDLGAAVEIIEQASEDIRSWLTEGHDPPRSTENNHELHVLADLRSRLADPTDQLDGLLHTDRTERLRRELEAAIANEDYERAAELRDTLRRLSGNQG